MTQTTWLLVCVLALLATSWALIAVYALHRHGVVLKLLWREAVLRHPVLVIESDDWGVGPASQTGALRALQDCLLGHRDAAGRPAHMTLAMVLGEPDCAVAVDEFGSPDAYRCRQLDHPHYAPLLAGMKQGCQAGVFSLQLHGGEHFWPPALMEAASADPSVRNWLQSSPGLCTESLPPHLQTRWANCAYLPSRPLDPASIERAATTEVDEFARILGSGPKVAVPPTFVWNDDVEIAWGKKGLRFVVTPGRRSVARGPANSLPADKKVILNGAVGQGDLHYLVRDIYFEPIFGHTAESTIPRIVARFDLLRPALLETHRANFVGPTANLEQSLAELNALLRYLLKVYPGLCFLPTEAIGEAFVSGDPEIVDRRFLVRFGVFLARLQQLPHMRRLVRFSGLILVAWLLRTVNSRNSSFHPKSPV